MIVRRSKIRPLVHNLVFRYCSDVSGLEPKRVNDAAPPGQVDGKDCGVVNKIPEEPSTCCMTGCPNCVWLDYAAKLTEFYKDGGKKAIEDIENNVTDQNIKAYLMHELRMKKNS